MAKNRAGLLITLMIIALLFDIPSGKTEDKGISFGGGLAGKDSSTMIAFNITLNADGTFSAMGTQADGSWDTTDGTWSVARKMLILQAKNKSLEYLTQEIPFNNGIGTMSIEGKIVQVKLPDDAEQFFMDTGKGRPDGMPGEVITPTPKPTPVPTPTPTPEPPLEGTKGSYAAKISRANATSFIEGKSTYAYAPDKMIDGNEQTAWQFSTKTTKLGDAYAYFTFDSPVTIDELWIKNGFRTVTKGYDQYTRNSRVKELGIAFLYEGQSEYTDKLTVTIKDQKGSSDWQQFDLGRHTQVKEIRFRILSIYKGTKYPKDVCISEVMFVRNEQ